MSFNVKSGKSGPPRTGPSLAFTDPPIGHRITHAEGWSIVSVVRSFGSRIVETQSRTRCFAARPAARPLGAASPLINPSTQHMCPSVGIYQRLSESIALKLELSNRYALAAGAPPMQRMITGLVCGPHL